MFGHVRSPARIFMQREFPATKTKLGIQRPLHHGSLATRAPVVPLPRYRGGGKSQRSHNAIRVGVLSRARRELAKSASLILTRHLLLSSLNIEGEAERRQTQIQPPRLRTARAQRSAHACRRSTAALT